MHGLKDGGRARSESWTNHCDMSQETRGYTAGCRQRGLRRTRGGCRNMSAWSSAHTAHRLEAVLLNKPTCHVILRRNGATHDSASSWCMLVSTDEPKSRLVHHNPKRFYPYDVSPPFNFCYHTQALYPIPRRLLLPHLCLQL